MNWYYVDEGHQAGPVDEAQFQALIQSGKITPQTLVWKEGMAQWLPCRDVRPVAPSSPDSLPAPPFPSGPSPEADPNSLQSAPSLTPHGSMVTCAECGRIFPREETIQYESHQICAECKPVFLQRITEGGQPGFAPVEYAGFWIRFVAKFIDGLVMAVLIGIPLGILFVLGGASFLDSGNNSADAVAILFQVVLQIGMMLLAVLYSTWFLGRYGATPGKMACGLRVITGDGQPVSYLRAFGRGWAEQLSGWICYIGYIMVVFDDQKRALHDHICNTRVVRK